MTVSLNIFLDDLLKMRNEKSSEGQASEDYHCANTNKVVIVDDNAQLSQANRLQNSLSFASSTVSSSSHLSTRWCSQPRFQLNETNKRVRRSSYGANADWDDVRVQPRRGSMSALDENATLRTSKSLSDFSAPKVPLRPKSPYRYRRSSKSVLDCTMEVDSLPRLGRTHSSDSEAEAELSSKLRNALGSMAPSLHASLSDSSSSKRSSSSSSKSKKKQKDTIAATSTSGFSKSSSKNTIMRSRDSFTIMNKHPK